ncbi:MAG: IS4 family transposase [Candidatus Competibacteraceae bacterium]|nr:IS4 family transposase [Candidatus Competibacteraceae bacterium]
MAEREFSGVFDNMISKEQLGALCREHEPVARRERKRTTEEVVADLVYHQLHEDGTLAEHGARLGGNTISDGAYTQRRQLLPEQLFEEVMRVALQPLAKVQEHADGFYQGWRLVGVDGTEASVTNTPANKILSKANTRRGKAAFAKLKLVTAMELGTHNPLAAAIGKLADYEVDLALKLWPRLPEKTLAIVDRLYGVGRHMAQMLEASQGREIALLVRVRSQRGKSRLLKALGDGSKLIEILPKPRPGQAAGAPIIVREIQAILQVPGGKTVTVRLWTSLLDATLYPAHALAELYARRWEHELAYRELKLDMRTGDVLNSHTPETALQELAAIVLATALVARLRVAASEALALPPCRVSLRKLLLATRSLWDAIELGGSILSAAQKAHMSERFFQRLEREAVLPARRKRHCPRAVRQPVSSWPRLIDRSEASGQVSITIIA